MNKLLTRVKRRLLRAAGVHYRRSYAQCGEDLIVQFVFDALGQSRVKYLDLGAHHPTYLSNTYAFYRTGNRGVNVDASPSAIRRFEAVRPHDRNLNVGIGPARGRLAFFEMSVPTLSTFSEEQARHYEREGSARVVRTTDIEVSTFHDIVDEYCRGTPDFVSLDVEGLDVQILRAVDFGRCRPPVFCVETLTFSTSRQGVRITEIDEVMEAGGYLRYADTHVNTIYVAREVWKEA